MNCGDWIEITGALLEYADKGSFTCQLLEGHAGPHCYLGITDEDTVKYHIEWYRLDKESSE